MFKQGGWKYLHQLFENKLYTSFTVLMRLFVFHVWCFADIHRWCRLAMWMDQEWNFKTCRTPVDGKNQLATLDVWASIPRHPPPHPMVMGLHSSAPVPPSPLWCGWCGWWWVVVGGGVPPSPLWCGWCGWWWVVVVEEVVYVCIWMYQYPPPPCGVGGGGWWWWWKKLYMYVYECICHMYGMNVYF